MIPIWIGWHQDPEGRWMPRAEGHDWFDTLAQLRRECPGALDRTLCVLAGATDPNHDGLSCRARGARISGSLRARVREQLAAGPSTIPELAAALGVTDASVGVAIGAFFKMGVIRVAGKRRVAGRTWPCKIWVLTRKGTAP